jgi:hypothetical protein
LIARALAAAHGRPILAEPATAEQIAQAGGRVWISNPLDAFRKSDQRRYLDWLQGRGSSELQGRAVVVVSRSSLVGRELSRDRRFSRAATDANMSLFVRAGS